MTGLAGAGIVGAVGLVLSQTFLAVVGALALVALVPVVWAIVDVARRPPWQFSPFRKAMWAITLGVGWLIIWPVALVSAVVYLTVLRRRFPPVAAPPGPMAGTAGPWSVQPSLAEPPPAMARRDLPAAGWYPDPARSPHERWWDGVGWTDRLR